MFKNVKCINTVQGKLLTWDIKEGHYPVTVSVYGTYEGKGWTLLSENCLCGQYLDTHRTLGLEAVYKLVGTDIVGNVTEINNIGMATYDSKAGLIAKEAHRREHILFNAHPYGKVDAVILMHKQSGTPCSQCSAGIDCPTEGSNTSCPECFGTGYTGGYYIYPKKEPMLIVAAHDDHLQPPREVMRNGATHTYRTVFTGMIREKDIICIGMDLYTVNSSQCVASVANIPIAYNLQLFKLLPEDIRYKTLLGRIKNVKQL